MPVGVNVLIDGKTAEVEVLDPQLRREIASLLVAAAQPDAWRIDVVSYGRPVPTYRAPISIVEAAGLIDHPCDGLARVRAEIEEVELAQFGERDEHLTHLHWSNDDDPDDTPPPFDQGGAIPAGFTIPARTGRGSSTAQWREFLTARGIAWDPSDSRNDLIARWDQPGRT